MPKKEKDWLLYGLIVGFLAFVLLFLIDYGRVVPLDIAAKVNPDGSIEWTFTGIAEIIVALCFGIGVILRLRK